MVHPNITLTISTKNRYDILAHSLQSVLNQSLLPKYVIIFDDNDDPKDLRKIEIYKYIFDNLSKKGIQWRVEMGAKRGQVTNHIKALELAPTEWIYRIDDDNVLEYNCLEILTKHINNPKAGAIASIVLHDMEFDESATSPYMADCIFKYNVQFARFQGIKKCEHLYSTFLFRKSKAIYPKNLSKVGHREDTWVSHEIFRQGLELIVDSNAITYHFRAKGGIRSFDDGNLWAQDEDKFNKQLDLWKVNLNKYKLIYLNNGMGDHYSLRVVLPEIKEKYKDHKIVISACYPEVFFDEKDCEIVSLNSGNILARGDVEKYNIYKWGHDNKHAGSLLDIYRKIYL